MNQPLLSVRDLSVAFTQNGKTPPAPDRIMSAIAPRAAKIQGQSKGFDNMFCNYPAAKRCVRRLTRGSRLNRMPSFGDLAWDALN
mgnify:CR=1 FL=1